MTVIITYEHAGRRNKRSYHVPNLKRRFAIYKALNQYWMDEDVASNEIVDIRTKRN